MKFISFANADPEVKEETREWFRVYNREKDKRNFVAEWQVLYGTLGSERLLALLQWGLDPNDAFATVIDERRRGVLLGGTPREECQHREDRVSSMTGICGDCGKTIETPRAFQVMPHDPLAGCHCICHDPGSNISHFPTSACCGPTAVNFIPPVPGGEAPQC